MAPSARDDFGRDQASQAPIDWRAAELSGDVPDGPLLPSKRLVLVAVGNLDLRAVQAVEQARRIPAMERRAVHVVDDGEAGDRLARSWMERELSFPLHFADDAGGIGPTIAHLARIELMGGFDDVTVLVGKLVLRRRIHRLLHDRTADGISRALSAIPAVRVSVLNVTST